MNKSEALEIMRQLVPDKVYEVGGNLNCRCPLCGDSKKSKTKRRFWVLFKNERINVYCHNCSEGMSFARFVKDRNLSLYNRYFRNKDLEKSVEKLEIHSKIVEEDVKEESPTDIVDVSTDILPVSFPLLDKSIRSKVLKELQLRALRLVLSRKIPKEYYQTFYVCYDKINGNTERNFENRLIIPYHNKKGLMYCFQGRALFDNQIPKYKTWNRTNTKIFNYYKVDTNETVLVTEGPVDSMFLFNGASTSGTIKFGSDKFQEVSDKFPKRAWVFDFDTTGIKKSIEWAENGELVFCWPKDWKQGNKKVDCNSIFLDKNLTISLLNVKVRENLFTGLSALARLKL